MHRKGERGWWKDEGEIGQGTEVRRRKENGHGCLLLPSFSFAYTIDRRPPPPPPFLPLLSLVSPFQTRFVIRDP